MGHHHQIEEIEELLNKLTREELVMVNRTVLKRVKLMDDPKSTCSLTSSKNNHLSSGGSDLSALLFSGPKEAG